MSILSLPQTHITPEVDAISKMRLEGNIIPHSWYRNISLSGHPDVVAITILADVVYWYRWREIRDEGSGQLVGYARRFRADRLQRSYSAFAELYGFTKRQVQDAVQRLVVAGLLVRELRTVTLENGGRMFNVVYLAPVAETISAITYRERETESDPLSHQNVTPPTPERDTSHVITGHLSRYNVTPPTPERDTSHVITGHLSRYNVTPPTPERDTYTEITTETTTETTTEITNNNNNTAAGDDHVVAVAGNSSNHFDEEKEVIRQILCGFGVNEPAVSRIAKKAAWSDVRAWVWMVQLHGRFKNPQGVVVRRLLDGSPPPPNLAEAAQRLAQFAPGDRDRIEAASLEARKDPLFVLPDWASAMGLTMTWLCALDDLIALD